MGKNTSYAIFAALVVFAGGIVAVGHLTQKPQATETPPELVVRKHGGDVVRTPDHSFEVVFHSGGMRLYSFGSKLEPLPASGLTGNMKVTLGTSPLGDVAFVATGTSPQQPGVPDHLEAALDLRSVGAHKASVDIDVKGFSDAKEPSVHFTVTLNGP